MRLRLVTLVAWAVLLLAGPALGAAPAPSTRAEELVAAGGFAVHEIGDGLVVVTSRPFAANSLIVETPTGDLVLVDSPTTPADTAVLLDWIADRWGRLPRWAITSHWHADASGGNQVLLGRGVEVLSTARTTAKLLAEGEGMRDALVGMFAERDPETAAELRELRPTAASIVLEVDRRLDLRLGGEAVSLLYPGPSHSEDSIGIFFPGHALLYGGCTVRSDGRILNRDEADPVGWVEAVKVFQSLEPVIVIPGHGARFDPDVLPESLEAARALSPNAS